MDELTELAAVLLAADEAPAQAARVRLLRTLLGDDEFRSNYDAHLLARLQGQFDGDLIGLAGAIQAGAAIAEARMDAAPPASEQWDLVLTAPTGFRGPEGLSKRTGATLRIVIAEARKLVRLYAPYTTAPGLAMLAEALEVAVAKGASIELTIPATTEVPRLLEHALPEPVRMRTEIRHVRADLGSWPHMKVVVIDGRRAYIGSANLTAPGLGGGNLELGVLVDGPKVSRVSAVLDSILEPTA